MTRGILTAILILFSATYAHAQLVVFDVATTTRNTTTAVLKELLLILQGEQHEQIRKMADRLSKYTDLRKYAIPDAPSWRARDVAASLFAHDYLRALNSGDPTGAAYLAVSHPVTIAQPYTGRLTAIGRTALSARLATIDLTDAVVTSATHDAGRLRAAGRQEALAIDALERDVVDPADAQSTTAVLDKISGAVLISGRQRQARTQLLVGVVENLLVDGKRARDAEAAAMTMQATTWRDGGAVNAAFVSGSADALRTWRQP